jgi:hypothetical protein
LVTMLVFLAVVGVILLKQFESRKKNKARQVETEQAVLEVATIADRRHQKTRGRHSTLLHEEFPALTASAKAPQP